MNAELVLSGGRRTRELALLQGLNLRFMLRSFCKPTWMQSRQTAQSTKVRNCWFLRPAGEHGEV